MERMRAVRMVDDFFVARPLQEAALELISTPGWERHLRTLATELRQRSGLLAAAVTKECPDWSVIRPPAGGLHLWLRLPPGTDGIRVAGTARQHGVAVDVGDRFFATEPPAAFLRLAFAAATPAELAEGARRLGAVDRDG